jgi:hypothetical protein
LVFLLFNSVPSSWNYCSILIFCRIYFRQAILAQNLLLGDVFDFFGYIKTPG